MIDFVLNRVLETLSVIHRSYVVFLTKDASERSEAVANVISACKMLEALLRKIGVEIQLISVSRTQEFTQKNFDELYEKIADALRLIYEKKAAIVSGS